MPTQAARTCIPHRGWLQATVPGLAADRAHSFSPHRGRRVLRPKLPELTVNITETADRHTVAGRTASSFEEVLRLTRQHLREYMREYYPELK